MTRISSAQSGLKALLDLAGSSQTTPKDAGDTAAFNSQLDHFGQKGDAISKDGKSPPAKDMLAIAANTEDAQTGEGQPDAVAALFAALADDTAGAQGASDGRATKGPGTLAGTKGAEPSAAQADPSAAQPAALPGKSQGTALLALMAKLSSEGDAGAPANAKQEPKKTGGESNADKTAAANALSNAAQDSQSFAAFADAGSLAARLQGKAQGSSLISKDGVPNAGSQKPVSKNAGSSKDTGSADTQTDTAASPALAILASLALQPATPAQVPSKSGGAVDQAVPHTRSAPLNPASFRAAQASTQPAGMPSQSDLSLANAQAGALDALSESASAEGDSTRTIKMNVTSIEAQTHLAPVQHPSPAIQIADYLAQTAGGLPSFAGSSDAQAPADASSAATTQNAGADAPPVTPAPLSMVKTLTLSLQPDTLGAVTVTMRLADSGLELQVEAEKSGTTSLIEKDKGNLADRLQALGYSIDSLVVKTAAPQSPQLDSPNDQAAAGQGQQAQADASASGQSQNGGRNGNDQSPAHTAREGSGLKQDDAAHSSAPRPVSDGLYI